MLQLVGGALHIPLNYGSLASHPLPHFCWGLRETEVL